MSKKARQELRAKKQQQQQQQRMIIIAAMVVGVLLIAAAIIIPGLNASAPGTVATAAPFSRPNVVGNSTGSPDAPIKMEAFSDFQCPYCARFAESTEHQIIETWVANGQVQYTYRSMGNFLSDNITRSGGIGGTESKDSIEAAYCAGDQGKFWEYHDILFANQTGEAVGDYAPRRLTAYAEAIGLDMDAFSACISSGKYNDRVAQDGVDGTAAGVTGTPSFLLTYTVNGEVRTKLIEGAQPISVFQQDIEAALAEIAAGK